jgi:polyhydroxybutyrate depolymerase
MRAMVICLHGTGGNAGQFERSYGFNEKADKEGFVAVYPDGVPKTDGVGVLKVRTWNAGTCCDFAMYTNVNDVKFISSIIDRISSNFHINKRRVYVTGMSNGGMLAYRLASELPNKIAPVGVVSGTMVSPKDASLKGSVPLIHIHAKPDDKVPFAGGEGLGNYNFPPVMEGLKYWAKRNSCLSEPSIDRRTGYEIMNWKNQHDVITNQCYLTYDGGHAWPSASASSRLSDQPSTIINATDLIWDFCSRFLLR